MKRQPKDGAAMHLKEIGQQLGITGAGARHIYQGAIRKLRADPATLERLQNLIDFHRRERDLRNSAPAFQKDRAA